MNIEIERKFLVNKEYWQDVTKPVGLLVRQGYLIAEPEKTIRVRMVGQQGFLTIKGASTGASRSEFEYDIPFDDAIELFDTFCVATLSKVRYNIIYREKLWEVDEFLDENAGLIVAEIELVNEEETFELPQWTGEEVTGDNRYYNSNLALHPFKQWQ